MNLADDTKYQQNKHIDSNGYDYQTIENDPNGVRIYELKNGLKVFLAQNFDAPRIQTYIPVRTGSNNDPADNTGLSHYLEHMMFKGTSKIGTQNWTKEKELLDQIEALYEVHKAEQDPEKKKAIYQQIDEVSQEASKFAIANEYDKLISSLGATNTNAHTWLDETVYKNTIPSNELERWLQIEKERFSELTLRLFHTELESVYEEFNRAQDNDGRLVNYALMELLFPTHPNGQQTTLGKAEHLKNPSMKAIYKYFSDFYVPNNYAMVLVGDLDFDKTIQLIESYFGTFDYKELPKKERIVEEPISGVKSLTVKSPTIPRVQMAWRTDDYGTREAMLADIVANILSNKGEAGLLDLNVNQTQTALYAQAFSVGFKQYGYFSAVIVPNETQTLDDGIALIQEQLELIKKGEFPDWLIPAIIKDFKIQRAKAWETADGLATNLYDVYIKGRTWTQELEEMDLYEQITKEEVVAFANAFLKDNYVVVYKEKGENENLIRVDNPGITPIALNRDAQSEFLTEFLKGKGEDVEPQFVDYKEMVKETAVKDKKVSFVKNSYNDIAQLHFIFPFGSDNDKELALATQVLQYLGTDKYSAEELRQEFYKLGISNDFRTALDELKITISGLEENIPAGLDLLWHWLTNAKPDQEAYDKYVQTIFESREAGKKDKTRIMNMLVNYAKLGPFSRYTNVVSADRLQEIKAEEMVGKMNDLVKMPYEIFYYGTTMEGVEKMLEPYVQNATVFAGEPTYYPEPETANNVFFVNYDMVQMEMSKIARIKPVDVSEFGIINVFNEYFGRGLSSIVFQEMRESKSLAYSAYVSYGTAPDLGRNNYIRTYIGTQPDKLKVAIDTLDELMQDLPQVELQFENAKNANLTQIATSRITRTNFYFNTLNLRRLGIYHDYRKEMYEHIQKLDMKALTDFYNTEIKGLSYNTAIIGKRENLKLEDIQSLGNFKEVTLEEIFGY